MTDSPNDPRGPDPLIGRVINDRYRIVSVIARGGMGKVYRAEQAPLGRLVALKVLQPNYEGDTDPEFHRRFFLEASISAKLTHPNTVTVFDYGRTEDDIYYIAMELLEGRTLHRAIREDGPLSPPRALHIARQICRSLREAHGMGVIHRDLKPANVYLVRHGDENDFVKVLDFGLVKDLGKEGEDLTQTGLFMGSPKYMAPEQIRGEKVDPRTDVYALGVITYEMMTGKVPFDRANSVNILMAHVHENAPRMSEISGSTFTPELEAIVMKAMAKSADDRYATMDEFFTAMKDASADVLSVTRGLDSSGTTSLSLSSSGERVLPDEGMTGTPSSGVQGSVPPTRSGNRTVIAGGLALAALAATLGVGLALRDRAPVDAPETAAAAATAPSAPSAAAPAPVAPAAQGAALTSVRVGLRSEPSGAEVWIGDRMIARTPADLEWVGVEATVGRQVTFTFKVEGYRDYTVMRTVRSATMDVTARLEEMPRRADGRPRPPSGGSSGGGSNSGRQGFHLNPY